MRIPLGQSERVNSYPRKIHYQHATTAFFTAGTQGTNEWYHFLRRGRLYKILLSQSGRVNSYPRKIHYQHVTTLPFLQHGELLLLQLHITPWTIAY